MSKAKIIQILNLIAVIIVSLTAFKMLVGGYSIYNYFSIIAPLLGIMGIIYILMIILSFTRTNLDNKYYKRAFIMSVVALVMKYLLSNIMASLAFYISEILLIIGFILFIIGYRKNKKITFSK